MAKGKEVVCSQLEKLVTAMTGVAGEEEGGGSDRATVGRVAWGMDRGQGGLGT